MFVLYVLYEPRYLEAGDRKIGDLVGGHWLLDLVGPVPRVHHASLSPGQHHAGPAQAKLSLKFNKVIVTITQGVCRGFSNSAIHQA